jgi:hypothetical protein
VNLCGYYTFFADLPRSSAFLKERQRQTKSLDLKKLGLENGIKCFDRLRVFIIHTAV